MSAPESVTIPRARYETLMRMALATHETTGALCAALKAELEVSALDPRKDKTGTVPATFGKRSDKDA